MDSLAMLYGSLRPAITDCAVMEFKVLDLDPTQRIVKGLASTPTLDEQGDECPPGAFAQDLAAYKANPVLLWMHQLLIPPVGKALELGITEEGLPGVWQFGRTTLALEIWKLVEDGMLKTLSFGHNSLRTPEYGERTAEGNWRWKRLKIKETSVVTVPANNRAQFGLVKSLGLPSADWYVAAMAEAGLAGAKALSAGVHIGAPHTLPPMPVETPWNPGDASEAQLVQSILGTWEKDGEPDWGNAKKVNVWWREPGDTIDAYKLKVGRREPVANDGKLMLNWHQTASRMAILFGARGGVDIPPGDRQPCYEELSRCYAVFDKPVPEFKGTAWPLHVKDVKFHNNELEIYEAQAVLEYLSLVGGAAKAIGNAHRHWQGEGGDLSPIALDRMSDALSSMGAEYADVLSTKTGEVLSGENVKLVGRAMEACEAAVAACSALLEKHTAAQERRGQSEGKAASSGAAEPHRPRVVGDPKDYVAVH